MNKRSKILTIIALGGTLLSACSGSDNDSETGVINEQVSSEPKVPIRFFEDTVYINKSGGLASGFLSYPLANEIEVVNYNSWLECSSFRNYSDIGLTSIIDFKANVNNTSQEKSGYVYFRYKESPHREQRNLMDSVFVIQLTSDSVLTDNKEYVYDEHAHNLTIYTVYSDYEVFLKTEWPWMKQISHKTGDVARTKHQFQIDALADEEDSRSGSIDFAQVRDPNVVGRYAHIEQRRAIIINNRTNAMKIDTERDLDLGLSFGLKKANLKFESSEPSVATISDDGKIKALNLGNTLITVASADGYHVTKMPLAVKKVLSFDDNKVQIGMGILISAQETKFYVGIDNGSDKDITIEKMIISNFGETVVTEESPSILGELPAYKNKVIYFNCYSTVGYDMSCRVYYRLDGNLYELGEDSGIIIK